MKLTLIALTALALVASSFHSDDDSKESKAVELGQVKWNRDLDAAKKISQETSQPILMLFQEVPGCSTCQDFGQGPLSHPLMVEAIETLFVPVLVYNNKKSDETLLKHFSEPAWNNPVIRFLDSQATDIIKRKDRVWTTTGTANRMVEALAAAGKPVPDYLKLVAADKPAKTETAEFAMHCYWEGEAKLGSIAGVKDTRSGWRDRLEVVRVEFDPEIVDYSKLLETAQSFDCASKVYAHSRKQLDVAGKKVGDNTIDVTKDPKMRDAKLSDQKYFVRQSVYGHLPLTSRQANEINSALYQKQPVEKWLSPRQLKTLELVKLAKSQDKEALKDFSWPDDDSKLAEYRARLHTELVRHSKMQSR